MSISIDQAKVELQSIEHTIDSLRSLVERVSGSVVGATSNTTYLLYSGVMPDASTYTSEVARMVLRADPSLVHVAISDAGLFINSEEFRSALRSAIKLEVLGDSSAIPVTPEQFAALSAKLNEVENGKIGSGLDAPRIPDANSLWDIASRNYTAAAQGNFRIIAPTQLDELSVFVQSELPALLENQGNCMKKSPKVW